MKINFFNNRYEIKATSSFEADIKKIYRQGKDLNKLSFVIQMISDGKKLPEKYNNHRLKDNNKFNNCYECHIEPDWLLVYKIDNKN